jgi:protein-S-isoprenylcysteine O-methyltransferase Ste14
MLLTEDEELKDLTIKVLGATVLAALAVGAHALDSNMQTAISIVLGVPSFVLLLLSRRKLGKSFSVTPQAKALVTTGLYAKVRHPMYLFLDLFFLSLIILADRPLLLILWAALVIGQSLRAKREEQVLAKAFGEEFERYRGQTWF